MSSYPFDIGDLMRITGEFRDQFGNYIDPAAVNVTITTPGGTVTTKVYLVDLDLIRDSAGIYHVDISLTAAGLWSYRWFSTGIGQGAATCYFIVEPTVKTGCIGRYATAAQYAAFAGIDLTVTNGPSIDTFLELAAGDIHSALGAVGACDCSWSAWVPNYLAKLNIIEAMVLYNAPCGRVTLTPEDRSRLMIFVGGEIEKIYTGRTELCSGYTGSDYPAIDFAQMSFTEWSVNELIYNTELKNP
jgi:hypothetical protein